MKSLLRSFFLLACLLADFSLVTVAWASDTEKPVPEYAMKAAYLYNFAQLTNWPVQTATTKDDAFTVCVYGQDELVAALEGLRGRTVNNRPLKVLRIVDVGEVTQCQLLYVGDGASERGGRLFHKLRGSPVLTVTDDPRAAGLGAMLQIVPDERRLAFEVNLEAARQAQLRLSSKLLHLARSVVGQ